MHAGMIGLMDLKMMRKAWELSPAVWHMIYKVQSRQLIQCTWAICTNYHMARRALASLSHEGAKRLSAIN